MEDVWALGDLARELKRRERALGGSCSSVEAQRAGAWRIGSGVEDQGGQALAS